MKEAAVVVGQAGRALHWHRPAGRTRASLPDSRTLWDVCWEYRNELAGIAHSHPGRGLPWPSNEDVTTFSAIELGLGRRLTWWITSADVLVAVRWTGPAKYQYQLALRTDEPEWLRPLRWLSLEDNR